MICAVPNGENPGMAHEQRSLARFTEELRELLHRFEVEQRLVGRESGPRTHLRQDLLERQHSAEIERRLASLHAADVAHVLEALTPAERRIVWPSVASAVRGEVLVELSEGVLRGLMEALPESEVLTGLERLDAADLAFLGRRLPPETLQRALAERPAEARSQVTDALAYPEDVVGGLMDREPLTVAAGQTLAEVQAMLRARESLPPQTDRLYVIDERGLLHGALATDQILLQDPGRSVAEVMEAEPPRLAPDQPAEGAVRAFERYDLISAPVVNTRGKLIGRLTVDEVMDFARDAAQADALNVAGVIESEDLFAGVWRSARNRWLWLAINLATAFVISRIIGAFETTIAQIVALAALMPIIASVAGNTGNQTTALVIRGLALEQIHGSNVWALLRKELSVALLNGVVWGAAVAVFTYAFYPTPALAGVVGVSMMLTFLVAALLGVGAPLVLDRLGRDPAMGSSVVLTGLTDALGFFILLALAALLLV
jgi:magnesium transporter